MKTRTTILIIFLFLSSTMYAENYIDQITELIENNRLAEAKPILQLAIDQGEKDERFFQYLGYIYEYEESYEKAIRILEKGIIISQQRKKAGKENILEVLYMNMANCYYQMEDFDNAVLLHTKSIKSNYGFAAGYKNRAIVYTKQSSWQDAIDDFSRYLMLSPDDPQKESIQAMIAALQDKLIAEAEARRLAEEQQHLEDEAQRLAEAERFKQDAEERRLEEERQKALLDAILNSLENASGDTQNISAGSDAIIDEEEEDELAD